MNAKTTSKRIRVIFAVAGGGIGFVLAPGAWLAGGALGWFAAPELAAALGHLRGRLRGRAGEPQIAERIAIVRGEIAYVRGRPKDEVDLVERYEHALTRVRRWRGRHHADAIWGLFSLLLVRHDLGALDRVTELANELAVDTPRAPEPMQPALVRVLCAVPKERREGRFAELWELLAGAGPEMQAELALGFAEVEAREGDPKAALGHVNAGLDVLGGSEALAESPYRRDSEGLAQNGARSVRTRLHLAATSYHEQLGDLEAAWLSLQPLEPGSMFDGDPSRGERLVAQHAINVGRYRESRRRLEGLIAADVGEARRQAYCALAHLLSLCGEVDAASTAIDAALEDAVATEPAGQAVIAQAAVLRARADRWEEAEDLLELIAPEDRGTNARYAIALLAARAGKKEEARSTVAALVEDSKADHGAEHPYVSLALSQAASIEATLGNATEAVRMLDEAVALVQKRFGPQHPMMDHLLGRKAEFAGDEAAAAEVRAKLSRRIGPVTSRSPDEDR